MFKEMFTESVASSLRAKKGNLSSDCKKQAIKFFKTEVKKNIYQYNYQLVKLTEWGFWSDNGGQYMVSIDDKLSKKIVNTLIKFLPHAPDFFIKELNQLFGFCKPED